MVAKDFIIESIDTLVEAFPGISVKYEDNEPSRTHFIEVLPNQIYLSNLEYQKFEENIVFEFIKKFPDQNICFISDDALVGINSVDYEVKGFLYGLIFSYDDKSYNKVEIKRKHTSKLTEDISILTTEIIPTISSNLSNIYGGERRNILEMTADKNYYNVYSPSIDRLDVGENNLAMAA
jgi:hypothetical protein